MKHVMMSISATSAMMLGWAAPAPAQAPPRDALAEGFQTPPDSARPRVWWHWLDGNISREGIRLDLEWMKRSGLAGFQTFDIALQTPQVVEKRLIYMTPAWKDAFRYAISTARDLGLDAGIASSPGWSETGGPWVAPEHAMKKLVWSETRVTGGRPVRILLESPPAVPGPFQDLARPAGTPPRPDTRFYRDVAVLAFPVPQLEQRLENRPRLSASTGVVDAELLEGPKLEHPPATVLPIGEGEQPAWIRFDYPRPQTVRSLSLAVKATSALFVPPDAKLEMSEDGKTFQPVADLPAAAFRQDTISFSPVTARTFRVTFAPAKTPTFLWRRIGSWAAPGVAAPPFGLAPPRPSKLEVLRLSLSNAARINRFEVKAGFGTAPDYYALATPDTPPEGSVPSQAVLDLTAKLDGNGVLHWTPPAGRWTIIRLGYSLTGQTNGPAPAESVGFEVDKLDARAVAGYMAHYIQSYRDTLGAELLGPRGVTNILTDSFEAGPQNWTDDMLASFQRLRGYDPRPFLPALAGFVIGSADASDRFLWDFRRTIAQMFADAHYGQVAKSAHGAGLSVYGEALEDFRPVLGDDMAMRSHADVPMGAFWVAGTKGEIEHTNLADVKGAASVAHLYGRPFVAAESLTSALQPWAGSPRTLKPYADAELALGVTRFMLHSSVHQPVADRVPGMTLSLFGQYFNRNETWAEQARPWVDYLARNAFMLQQVRYQADIAYFYGEEAPLTSLYGDRPISDVPAGYGFDFVDSSTLATRLKVEGGQIVTPSGMRYRILQLGGTATRMTLSTLRIIGNLVQAGATIVGPKPVGSPSLADDPVEFRRLADALWDAQSPDGKGRMVADQSAGEALAGLGVAPDWEIIGEPASAAMVLHRSLDPGEIYFVSSRSSEPRKLTLSFRVDGLAPELWNAETGESAPLPYHVSAGRTVVSMDFASSGSALIVFRRPAIAANWSRPVSHQTPIADLDKGWSLSFQSGRGGPEESILADAGSWSQNSADKIRYFSGTGTYIRTVKLVRADIRKPGRLILDLGDVRELVEVEINGAKLGTLWTPPYRVDVTHALHTGTNTVTLRVTNLWVNRLIGDAQPGARPITYSSFGTYRADAPLRPSGLIGPARLVREEEEHGTK